MAQKGVPKGVIWTPFEPYWPIWAIWALGGLQEASGAGFSLCSPEGLLGPGTPGSGVPKGLKRGHLDPLLDPLGEALRGLSGPKGAQGAIWASWRPLWPLWLKRGSQKGSFEGLGGPWETSQGQYSGSLVGGPKLAIWAQKGVPDPLLRPF